MSTMLPVRMTLGTSGLRQVGAQSAQKAAQMRKTAKLALRRRQVSVSAAKNARTR